jgi:hypothetical protein
MSSNDLLKSTIKEWLLINNKLKDLEKHAKELKNKKKTISETLIKIMENNDIDCFDINNGKIIHRKTKIKGTINKDYLLKMLNEYFQDNLEIDTLDVGSFILNNRPIKENSSIIIKENK